MGYETALFSYGGDLGNMETYQVEGIVDSDKAMARLEAVDSGEILLAGERVDHLKPSRRDGAFVFQSFSLYPHRTVFENMAFPLKARGGRREALAAEVQALAASLAIEPLLHQRLGASFVFVTHDQVEAMPIAGRIGALKAGRLRRRRSSIARRV